MGGLVYSGKFEEHINELYSPQNISKTAKKFKEYEKKNGPYAFGKFTKFLVPKKENWTDESGATTGQRFACEREETDAHGIDDVFSDQITQAVGGVADAL